MPGSIYSTRSTACQRDCGQPDSETCPKRRSGHTGHGFVVNLHRLPNGRWQQLRRQKATWTRKDAEKALAAEVPDIIAGNTRPLEDRQITVAAYAPVWLDSKVKLKPASRHVYGHLLDCYIVPSLGRVRLAELNAAMVDQWLADIRSGRLRPQTNRRRRADGSVSPRTLRHIFAVLQAMCRTAVRRKLIPYDPCAGVELEAATEYEASIWDPDQADRFLGFVEANEPRLAIAFRCALKLGMRRGEILALLLADVGEDIHIHRNAVSVGDRVEMGPPKSKAGTRRVPADADPGWDAALRRHRKRQAADRLASDRWAETGLLVTDEHGRMIEPWQLSERWRKLAGQAGLPPIRLHDARHLANSVWREAGIDSTVRAAWLGHGDLKMTEGTYNHVRPAAHADAARKAAAYWAASGGQS